MNTIDLKSNIHKIVDRIQSEQLLQKIYSFLKLSEANKTGQLWNKLTEEQRQEVLLAYDESRDDNNLMDREEVFR